MGLLIWGAKYAVNIEEIDRQHQKLFALMNELFDAMREGRGHTIVGTVLEEVIDYTRYHFATEEAMFARYGYPQEPAHRAEHAALAERAQELKRQFDAGQVQVTSDTMRFLADWLNGHILGSDKKYAPFLLAKGAA